MLSTVYPDHNWLPWKFNAVPKHYWREMKNQKQYLEWAGKQLNTKEMSDWYKIKNEVCVYMCHFV